MNTFLKILLIAALVILAIKFSPILLVAGLAGLLAALVLGVVGLSLIGVLLAIVVGVAVALSPIWIPVLVIVGIVSLWRRTSTPTTPSNTPPPVAA